MSTQENKAIVQRFFEEAWNQNKIAELDEYVAADNVGQSGVVIRPLGPEAIRTTIKVWRTAFPDYQAHLEQLIAEGDMVVARITFAQFIAVCRRSKVVSRSTRSHRRGSRRCRR
jgi:predicted ester cyclase